MQATDEKIKNPSTYPLVDRWYKTDWLKRREFCSKKSATVQTRYKEILFLIPLMVLIFGLTTPFNFSWSQEVKSIESGHAATNTVEKTHQGNTGRRVGLLLLGIYGVAVLSKTRHRIRINTPEGILAITYMGWALLSLTWSMDTIFTLRRVTTFYILCIAALATAQRYSIREIALLATGVCSITAFLALGTELRLNTIELSNPTWRFSGIFHPVAMGWNCGFLVLVASFLLTDEKSMLRRLVLYLVILSAFILLLLTKTRMAVASTLICMALYWFRILSGSKKAFLVLLPTIALCLSYLAFGNQILSYFGVAANLGRDEVAQESVSTLTGRIPLWEECLKWAQKRPIVGYGFNTFINAQNIDTIYRNVGWRPNSVHSGYVDALMGLGFVGAAMLIFFLIAALARAYRLSLHHREYIFIMVALLWLYHNLFMAVELITRPFFMTFFFLVLLARLAFLPDPDWKRRSI